MLPAFVFPAPLPDLARSARQHELLVKSDETCNNLPKLPFDILRKIAYTLLEFGDLGTVRSLQTLSQAVYRQITPILYTRLAVTSEASTILDIQPGLGTDHGIIRSSSEADLFFFSSPSIRRYDALRHVQTLTLGSLPDISISRTFLATAKAQSPALVFPRLKSIRLSPACVDDIRTYTPESYDQPLHPCLAALSISSRPRHLCLAFRLVPSKDWATWREMSTEGQYLFRNRIKELAGQWNLETLNVHDVVHQVIPSIPECINTIHFAPHVVPSSTNSGDYTFPSGETATGIPGPQWNLRAWQIGECVKTLFPSNKTFPAGGTGTGTTWVFTEAGNHILTKKERDDDDDTGVGWMEVEELIMSNVTLGLNQDLPARHGFRSEIVGDILGKIRYLGGLEETRCPCCHRQSFFLIHPISKRRKREC